MTDPTALAACAPLPWDSDFFGKQIGRGNLPVQEADQYAQELGLDCLYLLVPIEQIAEAQEAVRLGFRLVDVRVQFELKPRPGRAEKTRLYVAEDLDRLEEIARASFRRTRFYNDPRFDDAECDLLYAVWTMNACEHETVIVAGEEQVDGYVTLTNEGEIGLIAVAAEARQRGIGSALMRAALDWAFTRRLETLTVVTQGGNLPAQRLFQNQGGRTKSVGLWLHKHYDR